MAVGLNAQGSHVLSWTLAAVFFVALCVMVWRSFYCMLIDREMLTAADFAETAEVREPVVEGVVEAVVVDEMPAAIGVGEPSESRAVMVGIQRDTYDV